MSKKTMLIFDMSNLVYTTILDYHHKMGGEVDMSVVRHLILNKLIAEKKRHKKYAGEIVLAFDSRNYWRKEIFPYYKSNRKKVRDANGFDYKTFYPLYEAFKEELKNNFPVKCIEVDTAEADDIMAILAMVHCREYDICIVSSDKDLIQIQKFAPNIKQYSIKTKKFLTPENSDYDLFEHIVRGDAGDGIPNILSQEDVFMVEDARQRKIMSTKLQEWKAKGGIQNPEYFCTDTQMLDRFIRNRNIIDLNKIPQDVITAIVEAYDNAKPVSGRTYTYFVKNKLKQILDLGGF